MFGIGGGGRRMERPVPTVPFWVHVTFHFLKSSRMYSNFRRGQQTEAGACHR